MNRRQVIKRISNEARRQNIAWDLDREGARHTVYSLDGLRIPIPRHNEIADDMARVIFRECEPKLGKGWWR